MIELHVLFEMVAGVAGTSGTGTTTFGIGTKPVLESGTGTTLDGTGTILPLHKWYWYHPRLVPVPPLFGTGTTPVWYRYHPRLVPVPSCDSA